LTFAADDFVRKVDVSDAEIRSAYDANKSDCPR